MAYSPNYSFKGNPSVAGFQPSIRRRVPLTQALGPHKFENDMDLSEQLLGVCAVLALISLPLIVGLIPPNRFYGFRTSKTLGDSAIWYRANRFAGFAILAASAISTTLIMTMPLVPPLLALLVPMLAAVGACFAYLRRAA